MPVYEYECSGCKKIFEIQQRIADAPLAVCPECGAPVRKMISRSSFQLKGGGWYSDGYSSCSTKVSAHLPTVRAVPRAAALVPRAAAVASARPLTDEAAFWRRTRLLGRVFFLPWRRILPLHIPCFNQIREQREGPWRRHRRKSDSRGLLPLGKRLKCALFPQVPRQGKEARISAGESW